MTRSLPGLRTLLAIAYDGRYLAIVILILVLMVQVGRTADARSAAQIRAGQVEILSRRYMEANLNQEVGLRGYLATGDWTFLEPYRLGLAQQEEVVAAFNALLGPDGRRALQPMIDAAQAWRRQVAEPQIAERERGALRDLPAALDAGKKSFDELRTRALEVGTTLALRNELGLAQMERRLRLEQIGAGAAIVLLLILGGLLSRWVDRHSIAPLEALATAAEQDQPFTAGTESRTPEEVARLSRSLEALRVRVDEREQLLERQRSAAENLRAFTEVAQQISDEDELHRLLERALRDALPLREVRILARNASENRLDVALPARLREGQERFPIVLDPLRCRSVRTAGKVTLPAGSAMACECALGVPDQGAYACVPMLAAGAVIGVVNLQADEGVWTPERLRVAQGYIAPAAAALSTLRLLRATRERALRDQLTGAYNRRFVDDYLPKMVSLALRSRKPLSALMLDLDHFKTINDTWGHEAGDRVLIAFSRLLQAAIRASDAAIRYGGEEFLVVLPETDAAGAMTLAERIRAAAPTVETVPGMPHGLRVRVSVGVATMPDDAADQAPLLAAADAALYRAKTEGRDRVCSARLAFAS